MSSIIEYVKFFFNQWVTLPRLAVGVSAFFVLMAVILAIVNISCGAIAGVNKANKKAKKFFKSNTNIDYTNINCFYKKCVKKLGNKSCKEWKRFEVGGRPIQNTPFEFITRESVSRGGAVGFGIYLYAYIAAIILLVVGMMASSIPQSVGSIYICATLAVGGLGLFAIGLQLYFLDKRATRRLDDFVTEVYSRMLVYKKSFGAVKEQSATVVAQESAIIEPKKIAVAEQNQYANIERINQISGLNAETVQNNSVAVVNNTDNSDAIDKLNKLVDEIIERGDNQELVEKVQCALKAINDIQYTKPLDELRIKCIIKKLDRAV